MKNRRTTIYDIAEKLGVAPSTVSKALNNNVSISKKIQDKIKETAKQLNYIHNVTAANLRGGKSKSVGVIVPKINTTFFSDVIAGIEESCSKNNYSLIICQTEESFQKEVLAVNTLISKNVDCILISLSAETNHIEHLKEVEKNQIPLIQFDRVNKSLLTHTVVNNNRQASFEAVQHLVAMGYKKIAFLGGHKSMPVYRERKRGYLKAIKQAGLKIPEYFILDNISNMAAGLKTATELLSKKIAPDAFFTVTDVAALGAINAAENLGLNVPQDIGVVGFSNEGFSGLVKPGISSINQHSKLLGNKAADIYFEELRDKKQSSETLHLTINCELIIRESSSPKKREQKNGRR